jgi:molecular chaperone DnaK (HSP70)/tetratricopeptide (TPR) repeat protein
MNMNKLTVGIDIGTETTKVVLGPAKSCEIVRNDTGGHTTTTAVSFSANTRQIGETASLKGTNSVIHLNRLVLRPTNDKEQEEDPFGKFYMFNQSLVEGKTQVTVDYGGTDRIFTSSALLAMLLGDVKRNVLTTLERLSMATDNKDDANSVSIDYLMSVPFGASPQTKEDLLDAAYAAGMGDTAQVVDAAHCYGAAYQRKFPENLDGRLILVVDMGHSQTSVSVLKMGQAPKDEVPTDAQDVDKNEEVEKKDDEPQFTVLRSNYHPSLGAGSVDIRLWHHFQSTLPALSDVKPNSRGGQRLLTGVNNLKTLLSQLPQGSVTVENVGANDSDLKLTATRDMLAELCQPEALMLSELIESVMVDGDSADGEAFSSSSLMAVEVLGGGCRMPWVQQAILKSKCVLQAKQVFSLSHSFDDTSAALGAALIGEEYPLLATATGVLAGEQVSLDRRTHLLQQETAMATMDQDQHAKAFTRNQLESHVLEMRAATSSNEKHASLLPSTLDAYLNEIDDWLYSDEAEEATQAQMATKLEAVLTKTKTELCPAYFAALQQDQAAKEQELEQEAKQAQMERNGQDPDQEDQEEEDHDQRRLPMKRRLEIVLKNKKEANELFADGNFKFAAARYTKALSHCKKFFDLKPDETEEVTAVQLSLNLNLALAYSKLENYDAALRVCDDAVVLDPNSAKALYRRASVLYEKKRFSAAMTDVTNALKGSPEGRGAIVKLQDKIDWQIKKQDAKERKMAQKMFR